MRACLLALLFVSPALAEGETPFTLDPGLYNDTLRQVQQERALTRQQQAAPAAGPAEAQWRQAMQEVGTPQAEVRLILLLRQLNPDAGIDALADALHLHRLMLAGNARACSQLAEALRSGCLPSGLVFIRNESLAAAVEQRAAFQSGLLLPTGQPGQSPATEQPSSAAKASGASL